MTNRPTNANVGASAGAPMTPILLSATACGNTWGERAVTAGAIVAGSGDGRRDVLIGKLQTRYSISYEDAERQVGNFEARRP